MEDKKTNIYVNNQLFIQCKHLLIHVPIEEMENLRDIKSIDEVIEELHGSNESSKNNEMKIPPEIEFWGHCSNLQAWYENRYDPGLLHNNLALPLLKKLAEAGDVYAKRVFKEEIVKKFENGHLRNIQHVLYNGYLNLLNAIELESLFETSNFNLIENVFYQLENLIGSRLTNYRIIRELIDLILFIDLRFNKTLLIEISKRFPQKNKDQFVKVVLLHLNYKEFDKYTIPYGRFFIYFERFITYLYENCPHPKEFLRFIDSGYYYYSFSLEERFTYGTPGFK